MVFTQEEEVDGSILFGWQSRDEILRDLAHGQTFTLGSAKRLYNAIERLKEEMGDAVVQRMQEVHTPSPHRPMYVVCVAERSIVSYYATCGFL